MEGGPIWLQKQGLHQPAVHEQLCCVSRVWISSLSLFITTINIIYYYILPFFQLLNVSYLNPQVLLLILLPCPPGQGEDRGRLSEWLMVLSCQLGLNHNNSLYIPRKSLPHHPQQLKLGTRWSLVLFKCLQLISLQATLFEYWVDVLRVISVSLRNDCDLKKKIAILPTTAWP